MIHDPENPPDDAKARAARYRAKAATVRKAAALAGDLTRPTLLQVAEIYDKIASSLQEMASKRPPPDPPDKQA
jgi:hypothetical protein